MWFENIIQDKKEINPLKSESHLDNLLRVMNNN